MIPKVLFEAQNHILRLWQAQRSIIFLCAILRRKRGVESQRRHEEKGNVREIDGDDERMEIGANGK